MTKEELLKIYSAYLPYGLQLQHKYEKAKHNGETVLRSWVKSLEPLDLGCLFPHRKDSFDWKPILYDLSYLTKEIEHEGVKKILAKELFAGKWKEISEYYVNTNQILKLSYDCIQALLKHHFNVFGLEESEYINKATLTNK